MQTILDWKGPLSTYKYPAQHKNRVLYQSTSLWNFEIMGRNIAEIQQGPKTKYYLCWFRTSKQQQKKKKTKQNTMSSNSEEKCFQSRILHLPKQNQMWRQKKKKKPTDILTWKAQKITSWVLFLRKLVEDWEFQVLTNLRGKNNSSQSKKLPGEPVLNRFSW